MTPHVRNRSHRERCGVGTYCRSVDTYYVWYRHAILLHHGTFRWETSRSMSQKWQVGSINRVKRNEAPIHVSRSCKKKKDLVKFASSPNGHSFWNQMILITTHCSLQLNNPRSCRQAEASSAAVQGGRVCRKVDPSSSDTTPRTAIPGTSPF
jgi:hypothetical protein